MFKKNDTIQSYKYTIDPEINPYSIYSKKYIDTNSINWNEMKNSSIDLVVNKNEMINKNKRLLTTKFSLLVDWVTRNSLNADIKNLLLEKIRNKVKLFGNSPAYSSNFFIKPK
mgnify:FL=1